MRSYFTSESVTSGHPDKLCDKVADSILDAIINQDPAAHVACEVTATTDKLHIMGEVTADANTDYAAIARNVIAKIGYTAPGNGFDAQSCTIIVDIHEQSQDIARGVNKRDPLDSGAGDQGLMFGFACRETRNLMPLPIELAHRLAKQLEAVRKSGELPWLLPDGKSQVTVEYDGDEPKRISSVIISAQHLDSVDTGVIKKEMIDHVVRAALPARMLDDATQYFINPTGRFVIGGPAGDSGLTGRKIIVDTYGGYARHGGGAFSGKDPTKVDRSAAYMARYIAKNIVAAGLCDKCEVQLSYAIGIAAPIALRVDDFGTGEVPADKLCDFLLSSVDMRPKAIINKFDLLRPIYAGLSSYGHFGENARNMPWEQTDLADALLTRFGDCRKVNQKSTLRACERPVMG